MFYTGVQRRGYGRGYGFLGQLARAQRGSLSAAGVLCNLIVQFSSS